MSVYLLTYCDLINYQDVWLYLPVYFLAITDICYWFYFSDVYIVFIDCIEPYPCYMFWPWMTLNIYAYGHKDCTNLY